MNKNYDVIIIGGGVIGTSTGYYLSKSGMKVLLLEKDYLTAGSTGRCITGVRQQFSTPATIRTAMSAVKLFENMKDELGVDVEWTNSGYMFMAHDEAKVEAFKKNIEIQRKFGLDVSFITASEAKALVPHLDTDQLLGVAWCPSDGQASPFKVVLGYARGIRDNGGSIITRQEVTDIIVEDGHVKGVTTAAGVTYHSSRVINCAGPWAREVGLMAGIDLQVEPERHEALITDGVQYENMPMLVDYRADGGYFVQRVTGQFIGCFTPEVQVPGKDKSSTLEFMKEMSRRMCKIVPALENVAILRQWAGSYCMTPDGSPIVDETPVKGLYCSVGMSGHGFMLGPALGKFLAEYIVDGTWPFDMSEFAYGRKFGDKEAMA
ncbi:FAD-binding oxidoreductase [bacterium]|nr:FAD-binding oxidoreductase [bacterium]